MLNARDASLDVCGSIASTPPCCSPTFLRCWSMVFTYSKSRCVFSHGSSISTSVPLPTGMASVHSQMRSISSSFGDPRRSNTCVTACGAVDDRANRVEARRSRRKFHSTTRNRYFRVQSLVSDAIWLEPHPTVGTNRGPPQPIGFETRVKANDRTTDNIRPSNQSGERQRTWRVITIHVFCEKGVLDVTGEEGVVYEAVNARLTKSECIAPWTRERRCRRT